MQIHRVRGNDLQDALRRARRVHGDRALVVSHETLPDGGVALAVARGPEALSRKPAPELVRTDYLSVGERNRVQRDDPRPEEHVGLRDVASHLTEAGASPALVEKVLAGVDRSRLDGEHAIDLAAEAIGSLFKVARSPRIPGKTRLMTMIGPPGGGKTTTMIKLAYRLAQAKRDVAFATFDTHRVGAIEKLRAWANRLRVPLHPIRRPSQVIELLTQPEPPEVLLLDTTGNPGIDVPRLTALSKLEETAHMQSFLVMPATDSRSALSMQAASFEGIRLSGVVVTKVDETREPAPTLEYAHEHDLAIAFFSDGQDVRLNLHRASADGFADLMLRGRLS